MRHVFGVAVGAIGAGVVVFVGVVVVLLWVIVLWAGFVIWVSGWGTIGGYYGWVGGCGRESADEEKDEEEERGGALSALREGDVCGLSGEGASFWCAWDE